MSETQPLFKGIDVNSAFKDVSFLFFLENVNVQTSAKYRALTPTKIEKQDSSSGSRYRIYYELDGV